MDVCTSHDKSETVQRRIGQVVVFKDRLEGATLGTMIQPHFGKSRCVERNGTFLASPFEEFRFRHE